MPEVNLSSCPSRMRVGIDTLPNYQFGTNNNLVVVEVKHLQTHGFEKVDCVTLVTIISANHVNFNKRVFTKNGLVTKGTKMSRYQSIKT